MPTSSSKRVRVIVLDDDRNILLVRTWLSNQRWSLPGGGVNKGESLEAACIREVKEETALEIDAKQLRYIATLHHDRLRADLPIYMAHTSSVVLSRLAFPYNVEIIDRKWYSLDDLPPDISNYTAEAVKLAFSSEN